MIISSLNLLCEIWTKACFSIGIVVDVRANKRALFNWLYFDISTIGNSYSSYLLLGTLVGRSLFRNKKFVINDLFQPNASKICHIFGFELGNQYIFCCWFQPFHLFNFEKLKKIYSGFLIPYILQILKGFPGGFFWRTHSEIVRSVVVMVSIVLLIIYVELFYSSLIVQILVNRLAFGLEDGGSW